MMTNLASGAHFDKRRFQSDINLFAKKRQKVGSEISASLPPVDFFNSTATMKLSSCSEGDGVENRASNDADVDNCFKDDGTDFVSVEEVMDFRKRKQIKIEGLEAPFPIKGFNHLGAKYSLNRASERAIKHSGFECLTPIQMQSIPVLMENRDLIACAPTGSGKTLAFAIPLVQKIINSNVTGKLRALVIVPTRELARQIHREISSISPKRIKTVLLSKSNISQTDKKIDILISTPLRMVGALKSGKINIKSVEMLVIDESDKLFEMGFLEQIDEIVSECSESEKAIFSATMSVQVEQLAGSIMKNPLRVIIGQKNCSSESVSQRLVYVGQEEGKLVALRQMIQTGFKPPVLIFVDSVEKAKELFRELIYDGVNVEVIHSERTQAQRDGAILNFRAGKIWVLIATDIIGRGVDFKGVELVVNYDFPRSVAAYVHRVGRAGRAERKGEAVTFFTKEDAPRLKAIAKVIKKSGGEVPDWIIKFY